MKIAVSSTGKILTSQVDPRFGRCAYFVIIDENDMSVEAFDNTSAALSGGAGIQSAQFLASKNVHALITGNCGPNAVNTLLAAGIDVYVGQSGSIKDVIDKYRNGSLTPTTQASVESHYGMGGRRGMGGGGMRI